MNEGRAMMTAEEWEAGRECAAGFGPAALDALYNCMEAMMALGRANGGTACCGSHDTWHWPWCTEGPHDHGAPGETMRE